MDWKNGAFRIVCRIAYYGLILLVILFVIYSFLNWLTLFLWGDPSALRGEPRMFHPPQIIILHYTSMISPELGKIIVALLFSGCAFFVYLGYRQLTRKNSLDHPTRNKIAGYIRSHPGCHFRSIMRANGINRGTLSYHLGQLAMLGLVHEVRVRGMSRYFLQRSGLSALEEKILIHQNNTMRSRILDMLEQAPAVTRTDLKKGLGISGPALWYHMQSARPGRDRLRDPGPETDWQAGSVRTHRGRPGDSGKNERKAAGGPDGSGLFNRIPAGTGHPCRELTQRRGVETPAGDRTAGVRSCRRSP